MRRRPRADQVLRWVTWWPIRYWTDRFDELARRLPGRFEAIFLSTAPSQYPGLELEPESWQFEYRYLDRVASSRGFHRHARLPRPPFPVVAGGRSAVVVMTYADPTFVTIACLARLRRTPYHLFVANTVSDERSWYRGKEIVKKWLFANASGCLVTGPLQEEYARRYASNRPIAQIGNPLDNERILAEADALARRRAALRQKQGWTEADTVVAFVGRLAREKDLGTLIRAVAGLGGSIRAPVVAVGSGPERDALEALARRLQVDVRFPGLLQGRALYEVYATADVFVLPSVSEPWGLVVNEAMLFGLPVVVSDRVGSRHLVEGGAGFVFPAGDHGALTEVLLRLASDVALRRATGTLARTTIAPHTIARWADDVLETVHISVRP